MARTFATNLSPIDVYGDWSADRPLGYFEWAMPSGMTTASQAVYIKVTDASTIASGYNQGLHINYTQSGTKTGTGEMNCLSVDAAVSGDVPYAYLSSLYMSTSGNPTIGLISGLTFYLDNIGTGVSSVHMLDLQTGNPTASAASTREAYLRIRNHGTGTPTSVMFLQANNNAKAATNFIEQDSVTVGPVVVSTTAITSGTNTTYRVQCLHGTTTFYLLGVAAS